MTNEQKAIELLDKELGTKNMSNGGSWFHKLQLHYIHLLCEMAEWKEQQMIERACEWLKDTLMSDEGGFPITSNGVEEFIKDFKQAMKE